MPASKDVAETKGSTWILLSVVPWGSGQPGGAPNTQVSEAAADPFPLLILQPLYPQFRAYHGQLEGKGFPKRETPRPTKRLGVFQKNKGPPS